MEALFISNMPNMLVFLLLSSIVNIHLICCYSGSTSSRDLQIEVASHLNADNQHSGKLYIDDNIMIVRCRVINSRGDLLGFMDPQVFGKTMTSIGHAPDLILYNDTWKETFPFHLGSWDSSEGYWKLTIPRQDVCLTDEVHKQILAEINVGKGAEKLSYQTVVIDLHSDLLWNQQFGTLLGSSLDTILKDVISVSEQAVAQHPCTPDTTLLLLQLDTDIVLGISHDMFISAYTDWYNVTDLICKQHPNTVCRNLTMVDIKVTSNFVLLLTTKGLFVGELLTVESREQHKKFHWVHVTLPNEFESSTFKDLKLGYTPVCTSPTHDGDVQGEERVTIVWTGSSEPGVVPHVSLPPFSTWMPIMTHSVPTRSLAYDYETNQYFAALQDSGLNPVHIVSYSASREETDDGYITVFRFPTDDHFLLVGICIHPGTHHIYAYGSQVWVSTSSGNDFIQLLSLPSNDTIVSCSTSTYQGCVIFTSSNGDMYYGRAGVNKLMYIHSSGVFTSQQLLSTYITLVGDVMLAYVDNGTLHVQNIDVPGEEKMPVNPFDSPVAVQFLSEEDVVLFDIFGTNRLTEVSIGLQLTHRFGGSILIKKVIHLPTQNDDSVTVSMVEGYLFEPLAWEPHHRTPAVQNDLNLEVINETAVWVKLSEDVDPSSGWTSSDVGKTITMVAASSILITQYHNYTHSLGTALLPKLLTTFYPAGKWKMYNMKAIIDIASVPVSLWSLVEPECRHILIPDEAASKYHLRYLDVGDTFTFSVTAAVKMSGIRHSKKPLLFLSISNPSLFHTKASYTRDKFGSETMMVTLRHEIFNKGLSTITVHMPDASMLCPKTSFTLTIKCACPPSKTLSFIYTPAISAKDFVRGNPKNKRNKPLLITLKPNYRPPSHLGIAIPLSDNVYNADPAKGRPRDYYQDSKESGRYKQCHNRTNREECGCTDAMKLSSLQSDTDCRERAYILRHPGKIWPRFIISEQDKVDEWLEEPYVLTLREVNNRHNYFVTDTPSASLTALKEAGFKIANGSQLYTTTELKITLLGSELYHFQATVIEGFSYCPLQDEFQFYVDTPPLAYPTQMIIIASVSVGIGGAIVIIYLYYLSKHYVPPPRTFGSQCMDIHHD